jgi:hypothetical protein
LSNIGKQKWERAYAQLKKEIQKDSVNATARYVLAQYFFTPENPDFQIDSAYHHTMGALHDFQLTTARDRERLKRFPVDSMILVMFRQKIDSAAFVRARSTDTEQGYLSFLRAFPYAQQREQAEALRDEAAYQDAVKKNTDAAFHSFLQRYPQARRAPEARALYERLLFETRTADKRLRSYKEFLRQHPETPYRREAERNIFEISTASGSSRSFEEYVKAYPGSYLATRARNILYHLLAEEHADLNLPSSLQSDSLAHVIRLGKGYLVPFLAREGFGFMDPDGNVIIKEQAPDIGDEYRCGNITEDLIVLPDKILSRNGATLFAGEVTALDDLGHGFILIETKGCSRVLHKSGFSVGDDCIQEAKMLNGKLLALRKDNRWSVWTLAGRMLQPYEWDDISFTGNVILYHQPGKVTLATVEKVAGIADQGKLTPGEVFDEAKRWPDDRIWVRKGEQQGVLDQTLEPFIRMDDHVLHPQFFGSVAYAPEGISVFNHEGKEASVFRKIEVAEPWVVVKTDQSWRLFNVQQLQYSSPSYDSIAIAGAFAVGLSPDSVRFYVNDHSFFELAQPLRYEFIPGKDSTSFLMIDQHEKKTVYNHQGKKLFTVAYDKIQYGGEGLFIVHKKEKKGLVNADGKALLPVEYDAIGSPQGGVVSLLKAMKFGMFDYKRRKLIKPEYNKNLVSYEPGVMVAFRDGSYGFLGWDNKPVGKFEFEEIRYWNDTTALVKKRAAWMLYNIASQKVLLDDIKSFKLIRDTPDDKLAIIRQETGHGVLHNKNGTIIPLTFSDIVNVGSAERPVYFTEKHVEEASIFVVIYYGSDGQMLRKEVYEHDDYERIYCADQ